MEDDRRQPVYSILGSSSDLEGVLHHFVVGLAEQVDTLQDDESNSDFEALEERALMLAQEADQMGYPELARLATKVSTACGDELKDAVQKSLVELTELAQRVRLGHRGSA
ncbi:MAG: hypothetical protein NZ990_11370 [Myxococcota bacterium]|nr:hypothetical protein [Myxococcota bacterium]